MQSPRRSQTPISVGCNNTTPGSPNQAWEQDRREKTEDVTERRILINHGGHGEHGEKSDAGQGLGRSVLLVISVVKVNADMHPEISRDAPAGRLSKRTMSPVNVASSCMSLKTCAEPSLRGRIMATLKDKG